MRQGWKSYAACAALALALCAIAPIAFPGVDDARAAETKESAGGTKADKDAKTRQWTGTVVTLEKESLTVTKGTKKPQRMTFTRSSETRVQGDLEQGARVTVYYRENGRKAMAQRIVVKEEEE
jgi:hypothetical protein